MARYIDLIKEYERDSTCQLDYIYIIKQVPSVQKGKWIRFGEKNIYYCSRCGAMLEENEIQWRNCYFCYNCGADMRQRSDPDDN